MSQRVAAVTGMGAQRGEGEGMDVVIFDLGGSSWVFVL
jgi:hypothetical protein